MRPFRLVFFPEFGRSLALARGTVGRISCHLELLRPAAGRPRPANLLLPVGRAAGICAFVLLAGGAGLLSHALLGWQGGCSTKRRCGPVCDGGQGDPQDPGVPERF